MHTSIAPEYHVTAHRLFVIYLTLPLLFGIGGAQPALAAAPRPLDLLRAQVLLDMQTHLCISPSSTDAFQWPNSPGWIRTDRASAILVVVQITPELLNAAVQCWAEGRSQSDPEIAQVRARLRRQYIRENQRAFLLIVNPYFKNAKYPEEWKFSIGPVPECLEIVTIDSKIGKVVKNENTLDDPVTNSSRPISCLVYIEDKVNPDDEPAFNLRITGTRFHILRKFREKEQVYLEWMPSEKQPPIMLRFQNGQVKLISMVEEGIPWASIEEKYLVPKTRTLTVASSDEIIGFMLKVAIDLALGLVLR